RQWTACYYERHHEFFAGSRQAVALVPKRPPCGTVKRAYLQTRRRGKENPPPRKRFEAWTSIGSRRNRRRRCREHKRLPSDVATKASMSSILRPHCSPSPKGSRRRFFLLPAYRLRTSVKRSIANS